MFRSKFFGMVAGAALLAMASPSKAAVYGTVNVAANTQAGLSSHSFYFNWYGGSATQTTSAREFDYVYSNPSDDLPTLSNWGFCIETENSSSSSYQYTVRDLYEAPVGHSPDPGNSGMGSVRAAYLSELWGEYMPYVNATGLSSNESYMRKAAFQMAVWEITHELSEPWNVLNGDRFYIKYSSGYGQYDNDYDSGGNHTAITLANTWLGSLDGTGTMAQLVALTRDGKQDYIVEADFPFHQEEPVPEPGTLALLGFGAAAIWRRRRGR